MLEVRLQQIVSDGDSRTLYDHLYRDVNISQRPSFYLWLMDLFKLQPNDIYLDISCGRAQLPALAQAKGVVAYGLDLSSTALRLGQTETNCRRLVVGNSQSLPYPSNRFTVISNIGSLEHYIDMEAAVREMARVLKPGGRAFILVPNTFSLLHNIWIAFRQGRTNIDQQPIQRYAARQEWQQLLEDNNLRVNKVIKYERELPRTWHDFLNYLRYPKQFVRLLLTPFVPLNLAFCFVFVCDKVGPD